MPGPLRSAARRRGAGGGVGWRWLVSPAGALFAAVCFFLPWGRVSCAGIERETSGAAVGGWLWLAFASAAIALVAPFAGRRLARPGLARAVAFGAALLGLLFLCWRAVEFSRGTRTPLGRVRPEQIGFSPAFGFVGTLAGLVVALVGAWLLPEAAPGAPSVEGAGGPASDAAAGRAIRS